MYFLTQLRISISVALTYPDLLDSPKQWEYEEKKMKHMNMSFHLACSLIEGNKNQRGQHAWGLLLWDIFHNVNQCINECFCLYNVKEDLKKQIKILSKSQHKDAAMELVATSKDYDSTMQKLNELGAEVICQGDPGYWKYFNCEVFNNTYRVQYMSRDITKTELSQIQEEAFPLEDPILEGDAPDLEKAVLRHDAHRFQRTLQEYNQTSTWPSCQANLKS